MINLFPMLNVKSEDLKSNNIGDYIDFDYHQEISNTGFGDMLHDTERNKKYYMAIKKTIKEMHAEGRTVNVLDIGTGTGILSMMAVVAGADSVTACEAFIPMADCAERILEKNRLREKVLLIKKRSTDLKVGVDLPKRANLLIAEVLDTELIGEGAIGIYNHAHMELLTEDVICIPSVAKCYAQVVESPLAEKWNGLKVIANLDGDVLIKPPKEVITCKGETTLHDVQLSQLPLDQFKILTDPVEVFVFNFESKTPMEKFRSRNLKIKNLRPGSSDLIFFWWSINMYSKGELMLSCAPFWAHPEMFSSNENAQDRKSVRNTLQWRDHWVQAIHYVSKPIQFFSSGTEFILNCNHDEFSFWFDAVSSVSLKDSLQNRIERSSCYCGFHCTFSRSRIGQINDLKRNKQFLQHLEEIITSQSRVLCLGDGNILGLSVAKLGAVEVVCVETHTFARSFMNSVVRNNNLLNVRLVSNLDCLNKDELSLFTHVFAEPYFLTATLPWDNFHFGTLLSKIHSQLSPSVHIIPESASIWAVPVQFENLQKIRTPLKNCEDFDISTFDEMVKASTSMTHNQIEAQPLWEYPCQALAHPHKLINIGFKNFTLEQDNSGTIHLIDDNACNGIALWVDWNITGEKKLQKLVTSTGPTEPIIPGKYIKWNMFVRQGVLLFDQVKQSQECKVLTSFKPEKRILRCNFNFNE